MTNQAAWPYDTTEAVRFLHELFDQLGLDDGGRSVDRAFTARYPEMPIKQYIRVLELSEAIDTEALMRISSRHVLDPGKLVVH